MWGSVSYPKELWHRFAQSEARPWQTNNLCDQLEQMVQARPSFLHQRSRTFPKIVTVRAVKGSLWGHNRPKHKHLLLLHEIILEVWTCLKKATQCRKEFLLSLTKWNQMCVQSTFSLFLFVFAVNMQCHSALRCLFTPNPCLFGDIPSRVLSLVFRYIHAQSSIFCHSLILPWKCLTFCKTPWKVILSFNAQ